MYCDRLGAAQRFLCKESSPWERRWPLRSDTARAEGAGAGQGSFWSRPPSTHCAHCGRLTGCRQCWGKPGYMLRHQGRAWGAAPASGYQDLRRARAALTSLSKPQQATHGRRPWPLVLCARLCQYSRPSPLAPSPSTAVGRALHRGRICLRRGNADPVPSTGNMPPSNNPRKWSRAHFPGGETEALG